MIGRVEGLQRKVRVHIDPSLGAHLAYGISYQICKQLQVYLR